MKASIDERQESGGLAPSLEDRAQLVSARASASSAGNKPNLRIALLSYWSWGEVEEITAPEFAIGAPKRVVGPLKERPISMVPDRRAVKIERLQRQLRELEPKHGEVVNRLT